MKILKSSRLRTILSVCLCTLTWTLPAFTEVKKEAFKRTSMPPFRQKVHSMTAARELGARLFSDPRLSRYGEVSCQSCHRPEFGWVDGHPRSIEKGSRRSMPLWNLAWDNLFTWNGRAGSIAAQSILAATAPLGMNADLVSAAATLKSDTDLAGRFAAAFGPPVDGSELTESGRIAMALEIYVRSLVSPRTRFDDWIDTGRGLSAQEQRGFKLFVTKGNCVACHTGWRFSDSKLHDVGVDDDPGAGQWLPGGQYKMKTVGLRDVQRRRFYMHNGAFRSLEEVIQHYNRGGFYKRSTNELKPLNLTSSEVADLVAFLNSL